MLRDLAQRYRPSLTETTFQSLLTDLTEVSALHSFQERIYLNRLAIPTVSDEEAWAYIYRDGICSMQTVLHSKNVTPENRNLISIVVPSKWEKVTLLDEGYDSNGNKNFIAYSLPTRYFPPCLGEEDLVSPSVPFPLFAPEKALLDWLLVSASKTHEKMPPTNIDISMLNIPKLYRLADHMDIRKILDNYLNEFYIAAAQTETSQISTNS